MAYFNRGVSTKCSKCLSGMQVYEDIHKDGVWACPTCGSMNGVNFDKAETYIYPDSQLTLGVTHTYIPYNKEHEAEIVKWEHENDVKFIRTKSQKSSKVLTGDGGSRTPQAPHQDDVLDTHGLDGQHRDDSFIRAAEDAENKNK